MRRRAAVLGFMMALAGAPSAFATPAITGARLARPAVAGDEAALVVRAVDPAAAISGFGAVLDDGTRFGASACRPQSSSGAPPPAPYRPGDPVRFVIRPTFVSAGTATMKVSVVSGGCEAPGASVEQPYTLTVTLPGDPLVPLLAGLPVVTQGVDITLPAVKLPALPGTRASVAATKPCKGANAQPSVGGLAQARRATLCLINRERTRRGLKILHTDRLLKRAAGPYAKQMVVEDFFAHTAPDGVGLVDRVQHTGWPTASGAWRLGENLGFGTGVLATPKAMVRAWMDSTGHRANLLDRGFDRIGLAIALGTPGDPANGATYTTDFGVVS